MTKGQFIEARTIARYTEIDLSNEDLKPLEGYGIERKQRWVTTRQVAALIRWQAFGIEGTVNAEQIQQIWDIGKKDFQIME